MKTNEEVRPMCHDDVAAPKEESAVRGLSRRGLLLSGLATAAAATAGSVLAAPAAQAAAAGARSNLSVTLLGTAGGPPPQQYQYGISTALTVEDRTYVVDCGRGAVSQYMKAGLSMPSLTGIFLTHLHADHTVDYFSFPLLTAGVRGPQGLGGRLGVWGPGSSGEQSKLNHPMGTVPGTVEMTNLINQAYASSTTFFLDEHFGADPTGVLDVHDLVPPTLDVAAAVPFDVMEDDRVKVTAILVPHGAVTPALAYRFDTEYGSVVFSGDTARTPNIPVLAAGADLLLHEAYNPAVLPLLGYPQPVIDHIREVHTDINDFGAIAKEADVKKIVATHLSPSDPTVCPDQVWEKLMKDSAKAAGYRGQTALGKDLMRIDV